MNIFVFGSSLTSTYWNGAATYYRGIYKNLHRLGYKISFAEPAIYDRQSHRDGADVSYADVRIYESPHDIPHLLKEAGRCGWFCSVAWIALTTGSIRAQTETQPAFNMSGENFWQKPYPNK